MATQVKSASKGTTASWNRTDKMSFVATTASTGKLGGRSRDLLLLYLENGRQTPHV